MAREKRFAVSWINDTCDWSSWLMPTLCVPLLGVPCEVETILWPCQYWRLKILYWYVTSRASIFFALCISLSGLLWFHRCSSRDSLSTTLCIRKYWACPPPEPDDCIIRYDSGLASIRLTTGPRSSESPSRGPRSMHSTRSGYKKPRIFPRRAVLSGPDSRQLQSS
jgi:hypothetical protein